ncbi:MAG: isochorismatase family protein, partial [Micromonosporaceae bacterium]|nr:isochorismatase family protein [Micromonosporaceae bacterium]
TLVENISGILAAARRSDVPVFYTAQPGAMSRAERGLLFDVWGPGMSAAEKDTRIVERLAPRPGDVLLKKWRYSAFVRSPLETELRRRGRDQLVVCGVYAHVGCLMTACDAFSRDIEPFLVADGTADFTAEHHRWALSYAATRCAAVVSAGQVRRSFDEHPAVARSGARDAAGQLDA